MKYTRAITLVFLATLIHINAQNQCTKEENQCVDASNYVKCVMIDADVFMPEPNIYECPANTICIEQACVAREQTDTTSQSSISSDQPPPTQPPLTQPPPTQPPPTQPPPTQAPPTQPPPTQPPPTQPPPTQPPPTQPPPTQPPSTQPPPTQPPPTQPPPTQSPPTQPPPTQPPPTQPPPTQPPPTQPPPTQPPPTQPPPTQLPPTQPPPPVPQPFECTRVGRFPGRACNEYYQCIRTWNGFIKVWRRCLFGRWFSPYSRICTLPTFSGCRL